MKSHLPAIDHETDSLNPGPYDGETAEEDLWFLPGPPRTSPTFLRPCLVVSRMSMPRSRPGHRLRGRKLGIWHRWPPGSGLWTNGCDLLPQGWRHRLALMEASNLSWLAGDRVSVDRLGLWQAMRISASGDDTGALQRAGWAFRHLSGGPGPEPDLAGFLNRHEVEGEDPLSDRVAAWNALMEAAAALASDRARGSCLSPLAIVGDRFWRATSWKCGGLPAYFRQ